MKWIKFERPTRKVYTTLRMWTGTRDKLKRLAESFDMTLIDFLEALATQLEEQFLGKEAQNDELPVPANSESEAKSVEDSKNIRPNAGSSGVESPKGQSVSTPVPRQD